MSARAVVLAAAAAWLVRSELARRSAYLGQERAAAARRRLGRNAWASEALRGITAEIRPGEQVTSVIVQVKWREDPDAILLTAVPGVPVKRLVFMAGPREAGYRQVTVPEPRDWR